MGDMAEPWRSMRKERQDQVMRGERVSMKYKTEADREWGVSAAYEANAMVDADTLKELKKLGLDPVKKGVASFQITLNGRVGMYYDGKKGKQIRWNDGEVVQLDYELTLETYIKSGEVRRNEKPSGSYDKVAPKTKDGK